MPAYCLLSEKTIKSIVENNKNIKFIFLIRDPIDRSWSRMVKVLCREKGRKIEDLTGREIKEYLLSSDVYNYSNYIKTIYKYLSVVSRQQFFIGKFDEIANSPEKFLNKIFNFLRVDTIIEGDLYYYKNILNKAVNVASKNISILLKYEKLIAEVQLENLRKLDDFLLGGVNDWIKRAEKALNY